MAKPTCPTFSNMATEWDDLTYNLRVLLDDFDSDRYDSDEIKGMLRCMLHDLFSVAANNLHPTEKNIKRLDDLLIKHTGESHLHTTKTYQLEKALAGEPVVEVKKIKEGWKGHLDCSACQMKSEWDIYKNGKYSHSVCNNHKA